MATRHHFFVGLVTGLVGCGTDQVGATPAAGTPRAEVAQDAAVQDSVNVVNAPNPGAVPTPRDPKACEGASCGGREAKVSALSEAEILATVRGYATTWPTALAPDALVQTEPDRAPFDCRAPSWYVDPSTSEAKTDPSGHGHKLYYLYAKDVHAYRAQSGLVLNYNGFERLDPGPPVTAQPVGQVIIKEAWTDVPMNEGEQVPPRPTALPTRALERTWIDGKAHRIGEKAALFAMVKVADHEVPGSDAGWVYATLPPDGGTLTSYGTLPTCMRCHTKAPSDRIFGVKKR